MVTSRQIRFLSRALVVVQVACLAAIPAVLWKLVRVAPLAVDASLPAPGAAEDVPAGIEKHALAWYAPLWERDLKQPPIPPAPASVTPAAPRAAPSVLATFVSREQPYAHLIGQAGKAELLTLDDVLDGFRLVAIEPGRVQLESGRERVWIEMPKPKGLEP